MEENFALEDLRKELADLNVLAVPELKRTPSMDVTNVSPLSEREDRCTLLLQILAHMALVLTKLCSERR